MKFAVLGTNPELSFAEIISVVGKKHIQSGRAASVALLDDAVEPSKLVERLAGITKAGSVIAAWPTWNLERAVGEMAAALSAAAPTGKIQFGVSVYDNGNPSLVGQVRKDLKKIGGEVKRTLVEGGRSVRYVTSDEGELSSVVVTGNKLTEHGGDLALIAWENGVTLGRVEAVQDFENWSKRDFGRPNRDAKSGMLPPKLARLMLNLSGVEPADAVVLDPFCGSGTLPMEAMLLGFKAVIASDISEKAIADTGKNLEWVRREFPSAKKTRVSVYVSPAEKIDAIVKEPVDAIVTETYLGPPLRREANEAAIEKTISVLMHIYPESLVAMSRVMKPDAKLVIALPAFRLGKTIRHVPIEVAAAKAGFRIVEQFLYERAGQKVARDVMIMQKTA